MKIEEERKYIHKVLNDMKIDDEDKFMTAVANVIYEDNRKIKSQQSELEKKDKMINEAYKKANNYLYFADSSDYEVALYEVIRSLKPELKEKWDNGNYETLKYID